MHGHGVGLGYWVEPSEKGIPYWLKVTKIQDVRSWIDNEAPIDLRRRLLKILQYDLGHAGYYGERGQCVSYWGPHVDYKPMIPKQPLIALKHPTMVGLDGEDIWEKRRVPLEYVWEDLQAIEANLIDGDQSALDSRSYIDQMPRGGAIGIGERLDSQAPWFSLDEIEREEWHENWYDWRSSIALALSVLIHS